MAKVGIHLKREAALPAARERGADCVQLFLGDPQGWKIEPPNDEVKVLAASALDLYVHAPYGINLASGNNRVRIPSRKLLQETCDGAAGIGAAGVIVHGGHVTSGEELEEGFARWTKGLERLETSVPVLLENTAGGTHAMARRLEVLARLWERVAGFGLGFCLDTCHAHASGEPLDGLVDRVRAITGRVDLVHANDSKDPAGSGRDRHENLGDGQIGREAIVEIARAAGTPVIFETPGGAERHREDIATLRAALGGAQRRRPGV